MSIRNDIKSYIVRSGMTMSSIAEKMVTSTQSLSQQLSRESIRYSKVLEMADIMGYEIVWKKKE